MSRVKLLTVCLLIVIGCDVLARSLLCAETDATAQKASEPVTSITWRGFSGNIVCDGVWHDDVERAKYFLNEQLLGDGEEGFVALLAKLSDLPYGSQVLIAPTDEWIHWPGQTNNPFSRPSTLCPGPPVVPFLMNISCFRRFREVVDDRQLQLRWDYCDSSGHPAHFDEEARDVYEQPAPVSKEEENACQAWLSGLWGDNRYDSTRLRLICEDIRDEDWRHLRAMPNLVYVTLGMMDVSDVALHHISSLPKLANLDLSWTNVSDDGLKELSKLHSLRRLNLDHTGVGDDVMACLGRLPHLRSLSLSQSKVSDVGLAHLEDLNLLGLNLEGTRVTDAGLKSLKKMSVLRSLTLTDTAVTEAGILELQESGALPLCNFDFIWDRSRSNQETPVEPDEKTRGD